MPWKLVSFIFVLIVVTLFIGFNLDNRCNVSFIFYTYTNVPIFVSLLFAYAAGAITVIPFFIGFSRKKSRKDAKKNAVSGKKSGADAASSRRVKGGSKRPAFRDDDDYLSSGVNSRDYDID